MNSITNPTFSSSKRTSKPTSPYTKVEIPTNDTNYMGTHLIHQGDASKLQRYISGKKINLTYPDPGNNSQGIY